MPFICEWYVDINYQIYLKLDTYSLFSNHNSAWWWTLEHRHFLNIFTNIFKRRSSSCRGVPVSIYWLYLNFQLVDRFLIEIQFLFNPVPYMEFLIHRVNNINNVLGKILATSTLKLPLIPSWHKAMYYSELLAVLLGAPSGRSSTHSPKLCCSWPCFTYQSWAHPWRSCTSLICYPASSFIPEFNSPPAQASVAA